MNSELKVAVVQPRPAAGAVEANLKRLEGLVRSAHREHAPQVMLLPEAMTSPNMYGTAMKDVARPIDGAPYQLLRTLARELDCTVGGGFMAAAPRTPGTPTCSPSPTAPRTCTTRTSRRCGRTRTTGAEPTTASPRCPSGRWVGMACGFEWAPSATARRTRGKVVAMLGGSCWWSFPDWLPVRRYFAREHQYNLQVAREMAGRRGRSTGGDRAARRRLPLCVAADAGRPVPPSEWGRVRSSSGTARSSPA